MILKISTFEYNKKNILVKKHMKKVLVWLSWGVDSAVSAYLLKKAGYDVTAGFMINYLAPEGEYCPTLEDIEVAREVAAYLEIPFFTFDYIEEYEQKVLQYMYEGYKKGITPNPDIMCNSEIKFKVFLDEALAHGFDMVATGHYARIEYGQEGKTRLLKWIDATKDQSYFLAWLSEFQLSKTLFPIGHLEKSKVREIALEAWLPNATRKDSQGICFVGKVDLSTFLEKKIEHKIGDIKDTSGKILWQHKGVFYYTVGQRKWLDIGGLKEPVFVVKKDILKNELIVGTTSDAQLYDTHLSMASLNIIGSLAPDETRFMAKIRYRQEDQPCLMTWEDEGHIRVDFDVPQRAIAPWQICALYRGDELVLSGVIQ